MSLETVSLDAAFDAFDEYWSPRIVAELNGQHVKVAKLRGEFDWHHHDDADELFLVVDGRLTVELREDDDLELSDGELAVVPAGVEHRPVADEEVEVVLFEPAGTANTGNVESERTVAEPERLRTADDVDN